MADINLKDEEANPGQASAIDIELLSDSDRKLYDSMSDRQKAEYSGFGAGSDHHFDSPARLPAAGDRVIERGGALISLQKDRESNVFSGAGGTKQTHAAAIDIVAGPMGYLGRSRTKKNKKVSTDPSFTRDAARIYISQKSDVDKYLNLAESIRTTSTDSPKSTVAIKADTVRLVGRENIKLVTKTDTQNAQGASLSNAYTGDYGIQLVAMNDDSDLQPMVKGGNLQDCLKEIVEAIHDLRELFKNFVVEDRALTMSLIKHTHRSPFYGQSTAPDFENLMPDGIEALVNKLTNVELQLNTQLQKLNSVQQNYLETPGGSEATSGCKGKFILSKYNITN